MPDRRSFHTRRCGVFAEPKNKREALIKAENDGEYARFPREPRPRRCPDRGGEAGPRLPEMREIGRSDPMGQGQKRPPEIPMQAVRKDVHPRERRPDRPEEAASTDHGQIMVNILTGTSVSEASKAAKISMTTALYWMGKIFAALASWQDSIVLSGGVYVDEKYFTVAHSEIELRPDGKRYRGLSRNQWCVAVALGPEKKAIAMVEGKGILFSFSFLRG
jgi:hypothetical protein